MDSEVPIPSAEDVLKLLDTLQTAVEATTSSAGPILTKVRNNDPSLDMSSGLSLLLLRPHLLLTSLHHLVLLLGLRLSSASNHEPDASLSTALALPFASTSRDRRDLGSVTDLTDELAGELVLVQEVMDKVRGLETKVDYQVKKLIGLAEAEEARGREVVEAAEDDPLSFRPNPSAIISSARGQASRLARTANDEASDEEGGSSKTGLYRPPRVAAVPYTETSSKSRRTERRAPALLSEFASTLDGAPLLESTSGLSTRPVQTSIRTNSTSAKRAAELKRMDEFEEENMTRLVTSKRETKRRMEDEEALALGYGVGGPARGRGRRQNGLEAELEGVLGGRGGKSLWEGVGKGIGRREGVVERGRKRESDTGGERDGPGGERRMKKQRFEADMKRHGKKAGRR